MRVISGKYRHITLNTLEGDSTRPTKDMVKEAMFDSLQVGEGDSFLDLFSGSGACGIEAISRGANKVVFNDINRAAIKVIESNLEKIKENAKVLNLNYDEALMVLKDEEFDFMFVDPPYAFEHYEDIFTLADKYNVMAKWGKIIVEVRKETKLNETYLDYELYKEKKYGISKLLYFRREKND